MNENELKDELNAALIYDWNVIPITENHHKWLLGWYRYGDDGEYCFTFISPRKRRYTYYVDGGRVIGADIAGHDNGARIAQYWAEWGDKLDRLDAVLRLTPRHIQRRLYMLLEAIIDKKIRELYTMHDLFRSYAPTGVLLDFVKRQDEYIVLYRDDTNVCTPYIIHHLTDSGLYCGHYYDNYYVACLEFGCFKDKDKDKDKERKDWLK